MLAALAITAELPAQPLGTAFTYQGRLGDGGVPANGPIDFRFILYDAPVGGSQVGPIVTRDDVTVTGGLFTVALDFGAVFAGARRFLEVGVRPGASGGDYTVLSPRQELTSAPNALFSTAAPWTGVAGKPAGFADDTDDDVLGGLSCANGQVAKFTGTAWACAADADGGGDITAVTAGTGLSGGGSTGPVSLAVNTSVIQSRVGGTCTVGNSIRTVNQDGTVACEAIPAPPVSWSLNGNPLTVATTSTSNSSYAIRATSVSSSGSALEVESTGGHLGAALEARNSGLSAGGTNNGMGIHAVNTGPSGIGLRAENTSTTGSATGVHALAQTETGTAFVISAFANGDGSGGANTNVLIGLRGEVFSQSAHGVEGRATGLRTTKSTVLAGVFGVVNSTNGYGVFASGELGASGTKSFLQPHPEDPSRMIQFHTLEGNESGTYFRGTGQLANGRAELTIPEEWVLVTEADSITVQLTPIGAPAVLYVLEQSRERIVVGGTSDVRFHYHVHGVRRGFASYEPYLPNSEFRPEQGGVPFGGQWPRALRDILVQNGILNADYTPNEATAARLAWELLDADEMATQGVAQPPVERREQQRSRP